MERLLTFREKQGDRLAASADDQGANLPGGASAWEKFGEIEADGSDPTIGVIGMGNARAIVERVRADGFAIAGPGRMISG